MATFTSFDFYPGTPTRNGVPCASPVIEYVGSANVLVECIDERRGLYRVSGDLSAGKCLSFIVSCADCDGCGRIEVTKCLCTGDGECASCEACVGNVCTTLCTEAETCVADRCVECNSDIPCPDGKVCKGNKCVCPTTAPFLVDGKCLECVGDTVKDCQTCVNGVLVPITCSGACDPSTNQCVGCLQASDCDGPNECCVGKECTCCPGFFRDPATGTCEQIPECREDADCGSCRKCNSGSCDPVLCPDGKVCVGDQGCVDPCSCTLPIPCQRITDTCKTGSGGCGCVPCTGSCEDGCGEGCYCDGTRCVGNPCAGNRCPCTNGADCPPGFGCDGTGNCVPCVTLPCEGSACENVLGCGCNGADCTGYPVTPCTTESNCPPGFTCVQGFCVPCSAFPCSECNGLSGCGCNGSACVGDGDACRDTFTLQKSDEACTLTATLAKTADCACSPLTVNVVTRRVPTTNDKFYTLDFKAETRKGVYTGSLDTPLLDDLSSPLIVENDAPTSGEVTVTAVNSYQVFTINVLTGSRRRTGAGTTTTSVSGSFVTGDTASILLGTLQLPVPGSVEVSQTDADGNVIEERVYTNSRVTSSVTDVFDFPNTCTYPFLGEIGVWTLNSTQDIAAYGLGFGRHRAVSITSDDSRLPIFRWFKSAYDTISGTAFRKLYVEKTGSTYTDVIDVPEGLEACKYFKVTTDCSCAPSPDIYAVFCNPTDLDFEVDSCNKRLTVSSVIPDICPVNKRVIFYIRAGDVYHTWRGDQWASVAGRVFTSVGDIFKVEFGQVCDEPGGCDKVYDVPREFGDTGGLKMEVSPVCSPNATGAAVFFPANDSTGRCGIVDIVIGGTTYFPNTRHTLTPGSYTATIRWSCGCAPTTQTLNIRCCDALVPDIERDCSGLTTCGEMAGATYTVGGSVIPVGTVCEFLSELDASEGTIVTVTYNDCPPHFITLEPVFEDCCAGFDLMTTVNRSVITATVLGKDGGSVLVGPGSVNGVVPNVTATNVAGVFTIQPVIGGNVYALTAISTRGCTAKTVQTVVNPDADCTWNVQLETVSGPNNTCILEANTGVTPCPCESGLWDVSITDVVDTGPNTFTVQYGASLRDLEAPVATSDVSLLEVSTGVSTRIAPSANGQLTLSKVFQQGPATTATANVRYVTGPEGNTTRLTVSMGTIGTATGIASITVAPQNASLQTKQVPFTDAFVFPNIPTLPREQRFTLVFTFVDGTSFTVSDLIPVSNLEQSSNEVTVKHDIRIPSRTEQWAQLVFTMTSMQLEDACRYSSSPISIRVKSDGSFFSGINDQTAAMVPFVANERRKKFVWSKDGTPIFTEYKLETSVLPDRFLEQGANYVVSASCDDCEDSDSQPLCCDIVVSSVGNPCGNRADIIINSIPGTYTVQLGNTTNNVVVPASGVFRQTVTNLPEGSYDGYVQPVGEPGCRENFTVNTVPAAVATFNFTPTTAALATFTPGTTDPSVVYCIKTAAGTAATFTTSPPLNVPYSNAGNGIVTLVTGCGSNSECEQYFSPSPQSCVGSSVDIVVVYSDNQGRVSVPSGTGNTECDVTSLRIFGNGMDTTYTPGQVAFLAPGTYEYSAALTCACPPATGTFLVESAFTNDVTILNNFDRSSGLEPCGSETVIEQTILGGSPTLFGSMTETDCDCNDDEWSAQITGVTNNGGNMVLAINTALVGEDLDFGTGTTRVFVDDDPVRVIPTGVTTLSIPKITTSGTREDVIFRVEVDYDRAQDIVEEILITEARPAVTESLAFRGITSGTLIVGYDGVTTTHPLTFAVVDGALTSTTPLNLPVDNQSVVSFDFTLTDGSEEYKKLVNITYFGQASSQLNVTGNNITPGTETPRSVRFLADNYVAANGCPYQDAEVGNFSVASTGVVSAPNTTVTLVTSNGSIRPKIKATWLSGDTVVSESYSNNGTTFLPVSVATVGELYTLKGSCADCAASTSLRLCPSTSITASTSVCLDALSLLLDIPANITYTVEFEGVTRNISRPASGVASLVFLGQLAPDTFYEFKVQPQGVLACSQSYRIRTGSLGTTCA